MSKSSERGTTEGRGSALWGTGSRGGDRSSVLWGKGGRGILLSCIVAFALSAPLAAMADSGQGNDSKQIAASFIAPTLLNATGQVDVIIQSSGGTSDAISKARGLGVFQQNMKRLDLIGAVEATVPAAQLKKLQGIPGLTVTPDATVKVSGNVSGLQSSQLWPYESGNANLWPGDTTTYAGKAPAIAIVDSGIQARSDFGNRIVASVNLSTISGNTASDPGSLDDKRGHGTFVAGIAAGSAPDLAGASPGAPLVSIKVMNDQGMAKTSDVITACQWILDNKAKYNIRVANFSLHSGYSTNFYRDPLDQAVEKLWFNNVVVVAAAGNYGTAAGPSGVLYAPGNDPFVITVGAVDIGSSSNAHDDAMAPFSAYGYTPDGFYKPEVAAPGRYMVGPIPPGSTIAAVKAANLVGTDRIQLSGTSFSAPVVAGTVADMLTRNPGWTPDQVKGALMRTARAVHTGNAKASGLGEITATRAASSALAPNPNAGLDRFVSTSGTGGAPSFDAMSWSSAATSDMSWNSISWTSMSWTDQSWSDQAWQAMSWSSMSWNSMSWTDMSWTDMSWADTSQEDAAEGDAASLTQISADSADLADAATDPDTAVPVDGLNPLTALGVTAPVSSATTAVTVPLLP
jgi:serine protease AprX